MPLIDVIAIDGPVASGKSTVGRALAHRLGYRFLDTGLMYRAVTLVALRRGIPTRDMYALGRMASALRVDVLVGKVAGQERILVDGADVTEELRSPEVEEAVSLVSQAPGVRRAMVAEQRRMAAEGHIVMVGRDIGTVVVPEAAKVFLEASQEERARRRFQEVKGRSSAATLDEVRENIVLRDRLDSERAESPLAIAPDAIRIDTEGLGVEEIVDRIIDRLGLA